MNHTYLIEALAPLVFRSGKPFGAQAGADGAAYPLPSSLAGLIRTLAADQAGEPFSDRLKDIAIAGPLLAWRDQNGGLQPLLPKPADAIYLQDLHGTTQVHRLSPAPMPADSGWDMEDPLLPVLLQREEQDARGKPVPGVEYWPYPLLQQWNDGHAIDPQALQRQGLTQLAAEVRTHVALDDTTRAADPGRLYQTGGIDLAPQRRDDGWELRHLVFLAQTDQRLNPTLATFGGERRLSRLQMVQTGWPERPADLGRQLHTAGGLKLTLATPAIFARGHLPGWLDPTTLTGSPPASPGLILKLRAASLSRWQPVSGWDLKENRPRAMRKAVPAGAVYWFQILAHTAPQQLQCLWLAPLSDHQQDCLDGFGLAIPSPWTPL